MNNFNVHYHNFKANNYNNLEIQSERNTNINIQKSQDNPSFTNKHSSYTSNRH